MNSLIKIVSILNQYSEQYSKCSKYFAVLICAKIALLVKIKDVCVSKGRVLQVEWGGHGVLGVTSHLCSSHI